MKKNAPATDIITISSDSDSPAVIEEIPLASKQALGNNETEEVTETVEIESSSLVTNDHPDDEIMDTVEELGG